MNSSQEFRSAPVASTNEQVGNGKERQPILDDERLLMGTLEPIVA